MSESAHSMDRAAGLATSLVLDPRVESLSWLDGLTDTPTGAAGQRVGDRLQRFQQAATVAEALQVWLDKPTDELARLDREQLVRQLNGDVAAIDELLNDQLNALLHHERFQRLEASWRGLHYLVQCQDALGDEQIKIRVLNVSAKELQRDLERAVEFDQSELFQKVYEQEFGMPGGEPFGVLLADYEMHPFPSASHPHDDVGLLRGLSQVAAAAFCPIITNASPAFFGMTDFGELEQRVDHARTIEQTNYHSWRRLRESEDSRFLGLTLPRVILRAPHADDGTRTDGFCFREDVAGPDASKYLWGGAAFAWGEVLMRAFAQAGWLADIRGVKRDEERGGLVTRLPVPSHSAESAAVAQRMSTEVAISDELERQLSDLGFIPLCHCKDTEFAAFLSNQSIQKPNRYDDPVATTNAQISSMLQYMFCVSRFAHYIKVIGRDKTGSFATAGEFEDFLQRWIVRYVTADPDASLEVKSRHPLRAAQVKVYPIPGKPGAFQCVMHLSPHYELDDLQATVRLQAELTSARPG